MRELKEFVMAGSDSLHCNWRKHMRIDETRANSEKPLHQFDNMWAANTRNSNRKTLTLTTRNATIWDCQSY